MSRNSINLLNKSIVITGPDASIIASGKITGISDSAPDYYLVEVDHAKFHTIYLPENKVTSLGWVKEVTEQFHFNNQLWTVHIYKGRA